MALPQFSRNYTRSGAYENPVTPVDTQSGAIWGAAIQSMGNSVAGAIQGISNAAAEKVKKTQKYLDENAKFTLEEYNKFLEQTKKAGINNESFSDLALDLIKKKGQAYFGMRSGDEEATKNFGIYSTKISELIELGKAGMNADGSFSSDYVDNYSKVNTPGGASTVGIDPVRSMNYILAMPARIGGTKNGSEQWYLDENNNIRTKYTSDQITQAFKNGDIENPYINTDPLDLFSFDAGVVDDLRKDMTGFYNESGIVKNGLLGDGYLENEIKTINSGKVEYDFQSLNKPAVIAATKSYIQSKAKSYLGRPSAVNNLWNHQLEQGRNIKGPDGKPLYPDGFELKLADGQIGTAFDEETSKVFTESLSQYMYDILPAGKQGSVRKITKDEPTEAEKKAAKKASKEKVSLEVIDKIEIPTAQGVGPAEEGSQFLDMKALEKAVAPYGFNVKSALEVGGTGGFTLTKNVDGTDRTVTIFETMSEKEIKDLMKFVETGQQIQAPAEKPNLPFTN